MKEIFHPLAPFLSVHNNQGQAGSLELNPGLAQMPGTQGLDPGLVQQEARAVRAQNDAQAL